ncbi:pancreatic lipase-related protein 2-like [Anopheles maculipalpis]|uniref:pancreatic lipase-related protein 2-like n=1 Tax=Anopheles maculipalpis TaxID=1496333 RepID=UPI002158CD62|nr:pancreatic lipase-related protein 2-like [Anopheles maculipalpis]
MSLTICVLLALLLASAVVGVPECGAGSVAVPKDIETFECLTVEELQHLRELERGKRFDAEASTRFMLWTQNSTAEAQEELKFNDLAALRNSSFDPRNPTRILIHGWLNDYTSSAVRGLSSAYVAKGAYNVIGIDWSAGAMNILYPIAQMRVGAVADAIAKQIAVLRAAGQHPSQIVLVGHSLGAHVAGLTGKHFQTAPKLAAIIALDPAGPFFSADNTAKRVDALDAEYVEVIHTNKGWYGHSHALGQADFYPNGGKSQPGCITNACNHHKAVEYFRQSLTSGEPMYVGKRCEADAVSNKCDGDRAVMGGDLSDSYKAKMSGLFYLTIGK